MAMLSVIYFLRLLSIFPLISFPSKDTVPLVGSYSRMMVRPVVVFPQPDSPTSPKVSPRST